MKYRILTLIEVYFHSAKSDNKMMWFLQKNGKKANLLHPKSEDNRRKAESDTKNEKALHPSVFRKAKIDVEPISFVR